MVCTSRTDPDKHVAAQADTSLSNQSASLRSLALDVSVDSRMAQPMTSHWQMPCMMSMMSCQSVHAVSIINLDLYHDSVPNIQSKYGVVMYQNMNSIPTYHNYKANKSTYIVVNRLCRGMPPLFVRDLFGKEVQWACPQGPKRGGEFDIKSSYSMYVFVHPYQNNHVTVW